MYKLRVEGLRREPLTPTLVKLLEEHENLRGTFEKNDFDFISSIYSEVVIVFDENNDLWDYMEIKGLSISKRGFVLKTQFITDTKDDLTELRQIIPIGTQQLPELCNMF